MSDQNKSVPLSRNAATDAAWLLEHMVNVLDEVLTQAYECNEMYQECIKIQAVKTTARYLSALLDFENCLRDRLDPEYRAD